MKTCVLYSGGKDSSLMAVILQKLGYEVELVTLNFGVFDSFKPALESAKSLGFKHYVLNADTEIIEKATSIILDDGFPNNGINYIHKETLNIVSDIYDVVADGTRRDDRIPKLNQREISSIESRKDIEYLNLRGFGHKTINYLSSSLFQVKKEQSNMKNNSDYEIEIRYLINKMIRKNADEIFPAHIQTRVIGWKNKYKKNND
jgi:predicted subunit of tRNA(5-methylaminomethyl-2-thiouridylate) methyltransferase